MTSAKKEFLKLSESKKLSVIEGRQEKPSPNSNSSFSRSNRLEKKTLSRTGRAIYDFKMIREGDRILVAVSGGKDSWLLLDILSHFRRVSRISFSLEALHIGSEFTSPDLVSLRSYCKSKDIIFHYDYIGIEALAEEKLRPESSFCSFCARLRRGSIYKNAEKLGVQKIALGHNREDAIETLLLNLFYSGEMKSMSPKYRSDDGKFILIRPLIYVPEEDIAKLAQQKKFFILKNECPHSRQGGGKRAELKAIMSELEKKNPQLKANLLNALANVSSSHLLDRRLYPFEKLE